MRIETPILESKGTAWIHTFYIPFFFGDIFGLRGPQFQSIFLHEMRLSEGLQNCTIRDPENPNVPHDTLKDIRPVLERNQCTFAEDPVPVPWASPLLRLDVSSNEPLRNLLYGVRRYRARGTLTVLLYFNPNYEETSIGPNGADDGVAAMEYGLENGLGFLFRNVPCQAAPLHITGQPLGEQRPALNLLHRPHSDIQERYMTSNDFLGAHAWGLVAIEKSFASPGHTLRHAIDFVDRMRGGAKREAELGGKIYLHTTPIFHNIVDHIMKHAADAAYDWDRDTLYVYGDDPLVLFACSGLLGNEFERHINALDSVTSAVDYKKLDAGPVSIFDGPRQIVYMTAKTVQRCLERARILLADYEQYLASHTVSSLPMPSNEEQVLSNDSV